MSGYKWVCKYKDKINAGMKRSAYVFLICILFSGPVWAETLWMRHGLTTGSSDGFDYANAFQGSDSVQWGSGQGYVGAGDTLYVCGGPHDDAFYIMASGTKDNEIVIRGDCSSVNGSYKDGTFGRVSLHNLENYASGQSLSLLDNSYITIRNLTFKNPLGVRDISQSGLKAISQRGEHDGADNSFILGDESFSTKGFSDDQLVGGIVWNLTDGSRGIITANTITTIKAALSGGKDNHWDNGDLFQITDDEASIEIRASPGNRTHHITISNCEFYLDDTDVGFSITANVSDNQIIHDISLRDNHFQGHNNYTIKMSQARYGSGPCGQIYNITIKDNTISDSAVFLHKFGSLEQIDWEGCLNFCEAAGQPWDCCTGERTATCRTDCGLDDNDDAMSGLDIDGNTFDEYEFNPIMISAIKGNGSINYIRNNTFTSTGTQWSHTNLLQLFWIKDFIIENNFIQGPDIKFGSCDGCAIIIDWLQVSNDYISDSVIIRGNMIVDAGSSGDCNGKGISVYKGRNISVYNNVVINSDIGIKVSNEESENVRLYNNTIVGAIHGILINASAPLVQIKNNLILNSTVSGINNTWGDLTRRAADPDEDYNIVYNSGKIDFWGITQGLNSITGQDPKLTIDYKIQSDSPAIDAGILVDLTVDFDGQRVPNGVRPDIGAFEYYDKVWERPSAPKNIRFFMLN